MDKSEQKRKSPILRYLERRRGFSSCAGQSFSATKNPSNKMGAFSTAVWYNSFKDLSHDKAVPNGQPFHEKGKTENFEYWYGIHGVLGETGLFSPRVYLINQKCWKFFRYTLLFRLFKGLIP